MIEKIEDRIKEYEKLIIFNKKLENNLKNQPPNCHAFTNFSMALRLNVFNDKIETYHNQIVDLELMLEFAKKVECTQN